MPGSPPTTPNMGLPRYDDSADVAQFATDVNAIVDAIDASSYIHVTGYLIQSCATTRAGCLLCDGSAVSRSTYANLYAALGGASSPYGQGDGTTTFNVPDFRGRVILGAGTGSGLTARARGDVGGEEKHVLTEAELAAHSHPGSTAGAHAHGFGTQVPAATSGFGTHAFAGGSEAAATTPLSGQGNVGGTQSATPSVTVASDGGNTPHNTMQPYGVANIFIKT